MLVLSLWGGGERRGDVWDGGGREVKRMEWVWVLGLVGAFSLPYWMDGELNTGDVEQGQ